MEQYTEFLLVLFAGAILLAPVGAFSARFALKPIIALLSRRTAANDVATQVAQQGRRIELLESELAVMHESIKRLTAATEFQRQLLTPDSR